MKSPRASKDNPFFKPKRTNGQSGFTLIEIIVVMTMIVIFGGVGLFYGLDNLWGHSFRSERDILVSSLQHARAEAVANICRGDTCTDGKPHGVKILNDRYVIFQGTNYDEHDEQNIELKTKYNVFYSGIDEIIFEQLSGDIIYGGEDGVEVENGPWEITLTDNVRTSTSTITINSEGQILWTN